jgi:hypothetical protein
VYEPIDIFYTSCYDGNRNNISIPLMCMKNSGRKSRDTKSKKFSIIIQSVSSEIERMMKKYIPFRFKVFSDSHGIGIYVDLSEIQKQSHKYLNEASIFSGIKFI